MLTEPKYFGSSCKLEPAREVKAASTVTGDDFKGLRKLQDAAQKNFSAGVVLYDGDAVVPFGNRLHAVPISSLWDKPEARSTRTGRDVRS